MADQTASPSSFPTIDPTTHVFQLPVKRIHTHADLPHFLHSRAHSLLDTFLDHLSKSLTPPSSSTADTESFYSDSPSIYISPATQAIIDLIGALEAIISEAPPEQGPRRFGNVAFRRWSALAEERTPELLRKYLPEVITQTAAKHGGVAPMEELGAYLLGGFGSAQRLDFGTGHELSFFAFLCSIWVMGGFETGKDELGVVLRAFDAYLALVRRLILLYNLEPAGSHGVWGLDDHSFLPYIFGSAQLATTPEGLGPPAPGSVVEENTVQRERKHNMYMSAVGFIRDVKKGPFWEHSPYLFDISGAIGGWKKINKGMLKMYSAEVLGKFPVVQHFPFGSIFSWELADNISADALSSASNPHINSTTQPTTLQESKPSFSAVDRSSRSAAAETERIRLPTPSHASKETVTTPQKLINLRNIEISKETTATAPVLGGTAPTVGGKPVTTAPWAKPPTGPSGAGTGSGGGEAASMMPPPIVAPWAKPGGGSQGGRPGVVGGNNLGASVTVASTGSLVGGRVRENNDPGRPGDEGTKAPWAR